MELKEAGPATPVSVSDFFRSSWEAGDKFYVVGDIQKAREIALRDKRKIMKPLCRNINTSRLRVFIQGLPRQGKGNQGDIEG